MLRMGDVVPHTPPVSTPLEAKRPRGDDAIMLTGSCDIAAIEDAAIAYMPEARRKELRVDEISLST